MKSFNKNDLGFTVVEILLAILILAIIGVAGYIVAKHINNKTSSPATISSKNTDKTSNLGTYLFEGLPYPVMPASYSLIYKDTTPSTGVMYLTNNNSNQIISDIAKVCSKDGYDIDDSGGTSSQTFDNHTITYYGPLCDSNDGKSSNNIWQFDITAATNINYESWKSKVPQSYLTNLSSMNWVTVWSHTPFPPV